MRLLRETKSVCPTCLKVLEAIIYEDDNVVYIEKTCPKHGTFKDVYWSDYELYKWAERYYETGTPISKPHTKAVKPCFFNCGLCSNHKSHTVLAIIDATTLCNLKCTGCFAASGKPDRVYEPTKEQVFKMLKTLRSNDPPPRGLQFSGGEPTLRDDLPELVRMAKEVGFEHVEVNTNGVRIANDIDYFRRLLDAGTSTLYLQFDSLRPEAVKMLRGANVLPLKLRVIENARKLGLQSVVLVVTLAKTVNDQDLGDLIEFAVKNSDVVRCVNVQPISFAGAGRELDPTRYRITVPDFMKLVEQQTNGRIKVPEDWRPVPWPIPIARAIGAMKGKTYPEFSAAPWCGVATFLLPNGDGEYTPITRLVNVDKFAEAMKKVYQDLNEGKSLKAKMRLVGSVRHFKLGLMRSLAWGIVKSGTYESLGKFMRRMVMVGCMHFMDLYNMDLYRLERCVIHYATPDPKRPIVPFCSMNSYWRDVIEKKYGVRYEERLATA
jgi:hypothetical protein